LLLYFLGRVSSFWPGLALDCDASHAAEVTRKQHHSLVGRDVLPWTMILQISTSQVAGITGVPKCYT
jgi:hypothetical protein